MADQMKPTPRGFISGLFSDVLGRTLNMPSLPRTGIPSLDLLYANRNSLFNMMGVGDVQKTAERISYGEPLTTGSGMTLRPREETINAAMNVAPFVKPAAVMANRAAMTAGRAGERLAERVVPQVMSRGGLPAQLLGDVSRGSVSPLDVYHGTPHTLPPTPRNPLGEFDASKIGTGEGAQAYGYGIYTAENPAVAGSYTRTLQGSAATKPDWAYLEIGGKSLDEQTSGMPPSVIGYVAKALKDANGDVNKAIKQFSLDSIGNETNPVVKNVLSVLNKGKDSKVDLNAIPSGNLYKVDLPDEKIATMLDWDKPVIQQKNVMNALRQEAEQRVKDRLLVNIENDIRSKLPTQDIGNDYMALFGDQNIAVNQDIQKQALARLNQLDLKPLVDQELNSFKTPDMNWNMSGRDFYELLSKRTGSPQQASSLLQSQGVAGIRYLDEGSRATTGKQTSNFVVFPNEEKSMTILERNGVRAFPQEATYPQQAALDLAQQRAALPVSEGGLGLPPNNTPEMRAAAMGFDVPAYHGTNANVPVFDISKNITAKDIYSSPNPSEASAYATREGGNVMPLLLRGKVKDLTTESQYVDNQLRKAYNAQVSKYERQYYPFEQFKESFMRGQLYQDTGGQSAQNALVGELIGNRKSILKIPDAVSDFGVGESYVMQNPANIRSRFAAFDPFRKDIATATAMGVAAPDLLAETLNRYQLPQDTTPMYTDPFGNTIGSSIR